MQINISGQEAATSCCMASAKMSMTKSTKTAASQRPFEQSSHQIVESYLQGRASAAKEIAESARALKEKAEQHGLKMVAYLLNLVELEAMDCQKYIAAREQVAERKKA
jgi:hypothetical protein